MWSYSQPRNNDRHRSRGEEPGSGEPDAGSPTFTKTESVAIPMGDNSNGRSNGSSGGNKKDTKDILRASRLTDGSGYLEI